jgi:hypothetical protein
MCNNTKRIREKYNKKCIWSDGERGWKGEARVAVPQGVLFYRVLFELGIVGSCPRIIYYVFFVRVCVCVCVGVIWPMGRWGIGRKAETGEAVVLVRAGGAFSSRADELNWPANHSVSRTNINKYNVSKTATVTSPSWKNGKPLKI